MKHRVYFAASKGRIKIGTTSKPVPERLAQISASLERPLVQIGFIDGDQQLERSIHRLLDAFRIRGEWFRDCPEIRKAIDHLISRGESWCQPSEPAPRALPSALRPPAGLSAAQLCRLILLFWPDDPLGGFAACTRSSADICKQWTEDVTSMPYLARTALACHALEYMMSDQ
jgi:hypothetical protein